MSLPSDDPAPQTHTQEAAGECVDKAIHRLTVADFLLNHCSYRSEYSEQVRARTHELHETMRTLTSWLTRHAQDASNLSTHDRVWLLAELKATGDIFADFIQAVSNTIEGS